MMTALPMPPTAPYDPIFGLQEKVASLLIPVFQDEKTDELFAYQIACRSLQNYEPETRADFVNIGRAIAFGLASMVLAKEAFNPALELEDKKRVAKTANALNRSADMAERAMMERRRYQRAYPAFPIPRQEPETAEAQTQVAEAVTAYTAAQQNPHQQTAPQPNAPQPNAPQATPPQPNPQKPENPAINLTPPPNPHSTIHYVGPSGTNTPPNDPDPLITPAMIQAINATTPTPNLIPQAR